MFDSLFDAAVTAMDEVITRVMASPYVLELAAGGELLVSAILETGTEEPTRPGIGKARTLRAVSEHGVLVILGQRLNRDQVLGAKIQTELGPRWVTDVEYPDATTTELALALAGDAALPAGNGVRFVR